jgi:hypothetical protein
MATAIQGPIKLGAGPIVEGGRWDVEDKVHPHVLVVALKGPAIDELVAQKVLVPCMKAAKDLDLWPVTASTSILKANTMLHTPQSAFGYYCHPADCAFHSMGKPEAAEPMQAKIVQVMGYFLP